MKNNALESRFDTRLGIVAPAEQYREAVWSVSARAESPVYTLTAYGRQRINAPKLAYGNYSRGIILGCIYDQKHRPPEHDTNNPSKSQLIQKKNHRIEIINEDGKEEIRVETAQGQMRAILSKKGIELVNELDGGIEVSGKKINLKGKNVTVVAEKSLSMNVKVNYANFTGRQLWEDTQTVGMMVGECEGLPYHFLKKRHDRKIFGAPVVASARKTKLN